MKSMNKGFIKITDNLYKNNWETLYVFMKDFRPTYIEFRHWENDVWYIYGESKMFDKLQECENVPQYDIIMEFTTNKNISYEFKRV